MHRRGAYKAGMKTSACLLRYFMKWDRHIDKYSFLSIGSPYLCLFLIRIHVFFWLRVAVCLLHADQLELEVRHFVYQIQFLTLQRGPTYQLLRKTQAVSCGNLNSTKAHLGQMWAKLRKINAKRKDHDSPLPTMFFPTAREQTSLEAQTPQS